MLRTLNNNSSQQLTYSSAGMMNPSMQERLAQRHQRREERRKRELGDHEPQEIYFNASFSDATINNTKTPIGKSNSTGNLLSQQMQTEDTTTNNNMDGSSNRGRARGEGGMDASLRSSYTNGVSNNISQQQQQPASLLSLRPPPKDTRSYNYGVSPPTTTTTNTSSRRYSTNNLQQDPLAIPSNNTRGRDSKRGGVQRTRSRSLTDLRRAGAATPNGGARKKLQVRRGSTRASFINSSSSPLTTSTATSTPSASPAEQHEESSTTTPIPRMMFPKPANLKRRVSSTGTVGSGKRRIPATKGNSRAVKGAKSLDNSETNNIRTSRRSSSHRNSSLHDGSMSEMSLSSRRNSSGKSLRKGSMRDGSSGGQRRRPSHKRLSGEDREPSGKKERKSSKSSTKKKMSLSQSLQSMTLLQTPNENDDDDDETVLFTAVPTPHGAKQGSVCGDNSLAGHSLARHTSPAPRAVVAPSPSNTDATTTTNANQSWSMANPDQVNKWKSKLASSSTHTTATAMSVSESNHHSHKNSSLKLVKNTNNHSRSTHTSPQRQRRRNSFGGVAMSRGTSFDGSKNSDDWNTTLSHHTISNHDFDGDNDDDSDDSDSEYSMYDDDNTSDHHEEQLQLLVPSPLKRSLNDSVPTLMDVSDMATDAEEDSSVLNISRGGDDQTVNTAFTSLPSLVTDTDTSLHQITPPRSKVDERILRSSQKQSLLGPSKNGGGLQILSDNARNHNPTDDPSQRNENSRSHENNNSTVRSKSMSSSGRRASTRVKDSSHSNSKGKDNNSGHGKSSSTSKEKESRTRSRSLTTDVVQDKTKDGQEGSPPQHRRKSHSKSSSRRTSKNTMDDSAQSRTKKGGLRRSSVYDSDDNEEAAKPRKKSNQTRSSSKSSSRRLKDESNGENRGRSSKKKGERSSSKSKPRQASKSPKVEASKPRRGVTRNRSRSLTDLRTTKKEPKQRSSSQKMLDASCPENITSGGRRRKRGEKSRPRRSKTQDHLNKDQQHGSQTVHHQARRSRASTVDASSENKRSVSRNRSSSLTDLRRGDRRSPFEQAADADNTTGTAIFEIEVEAQDIEFLKAQIQKMEAELTSIKNLPDVGSTTESSTTDDSGSTKPKSAIADDSSKLPLAKPDAIINYLKGEKQREEKEQRRIKEKIFDMMQENTKAKGRLNKTQQYFSELEDIHSAEVMKNEALLKNVPVFQKVIEAHEIKLARRGRYIEFERQTTQFYEDRMRAIVRNFQANCDDFELVRTLEQMAGIELTDKKGSSSCAAQSSRAQGGNRMSFRT